MTRQISSQFMVHATSFFVTVASILGTGVLALPVKLYQTGFYPFLVTFCICLLMQIVISLYMIELIQHTHAFHASKLSDDSDSAACRTDDDELARGDVEESTSFNGVEAPDLHSISLLFLPPKLQVLFNVCVVVQFVSVMISYSLAGSQAYGSLFEIDFEKLIFPFVFVLTLLMVFGQHVVAHVISAMTLIKGSFLVIIVMTIGGVAQQVRQTSVERWRHIGDPFLIGTLALGGAANIMPTLYSKFKPTLKNLKAFRSGVISGVCLCFVLNVLWCLFILEIVPQTSDSGPSLALAAEQGQIATVPLTDFLDEHFPDLRWVGYLTTIFIAVSITVSFLTIGSSLLHLLDGYLKHFGAPATQDDSKSDSGRIKMNRFSLYFIVFGFVLAVALMNPKGFINILEVFASFSLNVTAGCLLTMMLGRAVTANSGVPLPLHRKLFSLRHFVFAYFALAVAYAIYVEVLVIIAH